VIRLVVAALAILVASGCAAQSGREGGEGSGSKSSVLSSIPFLTSKGTKTTLIAELHSGAYEASSLAVGEEKDLAQRRGDGFGFVRSSFIEQYLRDLRSTLVGVSGVVGVPGRVMILASPAFAAYSTPDGNIYLSMAWLENLESADEVAAILAHEQSHVLLKHHTSDLISSMQRKGQALHEIGVSAKTALSGSKSMAKSDARALANEQIAADVTEKLALPAWGRRQEREADLLGVDLLIRGGYSPGAMITMLEKLRAWEANIKESEEAFWDKMSQAAQAGPSEAVRLAYQRAVDAVSVSHPKTEERIDEVAEYLDRHYADAKLPEPKIGPWKAVASRPDVIQVMRNYDRAFTARKMLDKGKTQEAYSFAKAAAAGPTATDAYPNWVLARSADLLGRKREALEALRRALRAPEPVPQIYEELIFTYEREGNIASALEWTDKASITFGKSPRWTPPKIRLLRKAGRTAEAEALTLDCSINSPDWKRQCQEANKTAAHR
jgi:beta-barrel assembly-enhancing protease